MENLHRVLVLTHRFKNDLCVPTSVLVSTHGFKNESCCLLGVHLFVEGRGLRVEVRGFHVEGEGTMSRVEGNIFFSYFFFFWKR